MMVSLGIHFKITLVSGEHLAATPPMLPKIFHNNIKTKLQNHAYSVLGKK
jgi:hypothetical protein